MILEWICISIYSASLLMILFYSFAQLNLLINYLKAQKLSTHTDSFLDDNDSLPFVTIQLPVFNELYVMERLLDNMAFLEYPKNKLEIQVHQFIIFDSSKGTQICKSGFEHHFH